VTNVGSGSEAETTADTDRFGIEANAMERIEFPGKSIEARSPRACGYFIDVIVRPAVIQGICGLVQPSITSKI
jgi:hypothetical protein